jgi:hypothetical protein
VTSGFDGCQFFVPVFFIAVAKTLSDADCRLRRLAYENLPAG